jgi:transposase
VFVVGRGELTARAWAVIEPLLPPVQGGGRRWRDLPERYGPWKTAHERLRLWTKDGTWAKILDHVIVKRRCRR